MLPGPSVPWGCGHRTPGPRLLKQQRSGPPEAGSPRSRCRQGWLLRGPSERLFRAPPAASTCWWLWVHVPLVSPIES